MRAPVVVRIFRIVLIGGLLAPTPASSQSMSQAAGDLPNRAAKLAEDLADRDKAVLGSLQGPEAAGVRLWDLAVRSWKKEKNAGAGALLAEGVLFDCVSRLHGILTEVLSSEHAVPYFLDLAAQRPQRASQAFRSALKIDPLLAEARFRDARIRAVRYPDALKELETMAEDQGVLAYLAAMSRAETARALNDVAGQRRWYDRAASLNPGAPAPQIGLAALTPGTSIAWSALSSSDPYYRYPCAVMTPSVAAELSKRIAGIKR